MDGWEGVEVLGAGSDRRSISFFGRPGSRCPKDCFRPSRGWLLWPWLRCTVSAIAGMPIRRKAGLYSVLTVAQESHRKGKKSRHFARRKDRFIGPLDDVFLKSLFIRAYSGGRPPVRASVLTEML